MTSRGINNRGPLTVSGNVEIDTVANFGINFDGAVNMHTVIGGDLIIKNTGGHAISAAVNGVNLWVKGNAFIDNVTGAVSGNCNGVRINSGANNVVIKIDGMLEIKNIATTIAAGHGIYIANATGTLDAGVIVIRPADGGQKSVGGSGIYNNVGTINAGSISIEKTSAVAITNNSGGVIEVAARPTVTGADGKISVNNVVSGHGIVNNPTTAKGGKIKADAISVNGFTGNGIVNNMGTTALPSIIEVTGLFEVKNGTGSGSIGISNLGYSKITAGSINISNTGNHAINNRGPLAVSGDVTIDTTRGTANGINNDNAVGSVNIAGVLRLNNIAGSYGINLVANGNLTLGTLIETNKPLNILGNFLSSTASSVELIWLPSNGTTIGVVRGTASNISKLNSVLYIQDTAWKLQQNGNSLDLVSAS